MRQPLPAFPRDRSFQAVAARRSQARATATQEQADATKNLWRTESAAQLVQRIPTSVFALGQLPGQPAQRS